MFRLNYFGDGLTIIYGDKWLKYCFRHFVHRSKTKQLIKLNYLQSAIFVIFAFKQLFLNCIFSVSCIQSDLVLFLNFCLFFLQLLINYKLSIVNDNSVNRSYVLYTVFG